jgi:hypothetical protein
MTRSADFVDLVDAQEKITLKVNYRHTGLGDEYRIVSYDCVLLNQGCSGLEGLVGERYYILATVSVFNVRRLALTKAIEEVTEDIKDCVVLCDVDNPQDAIDLQQVIAKQGALAMITQHKLSNVASHIPVFAIPTGAFDKMITFLHASVSFQRQWHAFGENQNSLQNPSELSSTGGSDPCTEASSMETHRTSADSHPLQESTTSNAAMDQSSDHNRGPSKEPPERAAFDLNAQSIAEKVCHVCVALWQVCATSVAHNSFRLSARSNRMKEAVNLAFYAILSH